MHNDPEAICPKCHSPNFKPWSDLDRDELIIAKARPTKFTPIQRKNTASAHRAGLNNLSLDPTLPKSPLPAKVKITTAVPYSIHFADQLSFPAEIAGQTPFFYFC